jgi:hypothetical protein
MDEFNCVKIIEHQVWILLNKLLMYYTDMIHFIKKTWPQFYGTAEQSKQIIAITWQGWKSPIFFKISPL